MTDETAQHWHASWVSNIFESLVDGSYMMRTLDESSVRPGQSAVVKEMAHVEVCKLRKCRRNQNFIVENHRKES